MNSVPPTDDELLDLLRDALAEDVDPEALRLALASPILVGAREELAHLDYDSLFDDDKVLLRDGAATKHRSVTFASEALIVEIDILDDGHTLVGHLVPAHSSVEVTVTQFADQTTIRTDDIGRFRYVLAPGPVQLRFAIADAPFSTTWITR
jgi:hypothetical protein